MGEPRLLEMVINRCVRLNTVPAKTAWCWSRDTLYMYIRGTNCCGVTQRRTCLDVTKPASWGSVSRTYTSSVPRRGATSKGSPLHGSEYWYSRPRRNWYIGACKWTEDEAKREVEKPISHVERKFAATSIYSEISDISCYFFFFLFNKNLDGICMMWIQIICQNIR